MGQEKPNVLFVGSFARCSKSGHVGGQMFACDLLINSSLKDQVNWILVDSTATTNKVRSISERVGGAMQRSSSFFYSLVFNKVDIVLLFSSSGYSFLEKGVMALVALFLRKSVVFAPRSGHIITDVENSKFMRFFIKTILRKVDRVICQSEYWQSYFFKLVGGDPKK